MTKFVRAETQSSRIYQLYVCVFRMCAELSLSFLSLFFSRKKTQLV